MPKKGDKGHEVRMIQVELGIEDDGHYGSETEEAVKEFQENNGLVADGIAGQKTMEKLFPSTDLQESDAWIEEYHLPMKEYVNDTTNKEYIFIHHTAGWNNPYKCIDQWARDSRGRIATQYVIGGPHPKTKDAKYDGVVLEAFESNYWAYHLGKNGSSHMHSHSVGIEVCNFGPLTKDGDNYYTWAGTLLPGRPGLLGAAAGRWRHVCAHVQPAPGRSAEAGGRGAGHPAACGDGLGTPHGWRLWWQGNPGSTAGLRGGTAGPGDRLPGQIPLVALRRHGANRQTP